MPSSDHKTLLAAKMDSKEKYDEFLRVNPTTVSSSWHAYSGTTTKEGDRITNAAWWLRREHFRIAAGIYSVTDVMRRINTSWAAQYAVHVSNDEAMVAYTPSTEAGLADKQVKTTFGKFLRKHFITLTDAQIQDLEQEHRAELFAELLLATTREEIEYVYRNMAGDSACMRYGPAHFSITNGAHPSHVYEAPGMAVAYTQVEGTVKSRAVVWVNPADPSDKRYVRLYGDPVLQRLLERQGYVLNHLAGARIRKIPRVTNDNAKPNKYEYVVPYLDGVGGDQSNANGSWVVDEGGDYLRLLSNTERSALVENLPSGQFIAQAKSTSAYIILYPMPSNEFTSDLTGITYVGYQHRQIDIWLAHAKRFGICNDDELPDAYETVYMARNGDIAPVMAPPKALKTFEHRWSTHHDTNEVRTLRGYVQLNAKYYPNEAWHLGSTATLADGSKIKMDDSVLALTAGGSSHRVHNAELPALRKQGYVNAASIDGEAVIIHKTRATAHRTKGGTWFCSDAHNDRYVQTVQGDWVAKSSASKVWVFGVPLYTSGSEATVASLPADAVLKAFHASSYNCDIGVIMVNLKPEALNAAGVNTVVRHIESRISLALQHDHSYTWEVTTTSDGAVAIGEYCRDGTLDNYSKFAAAFAQIGTNLVSTFDYKTMLHSAHLIDCLNNYAQPHLTVLRDLLAQRELEAAGQARVDAVPSPAPVSVRHSGFGVTCVA